jgi:capsular exopolysaccharide synthesis family protein
MTPGGEKISAMELLAQLQNGGNSAASAQTVDFSHYLRLALRNIWGILMIVFLGTGLTVIYLQKQPKIYASTATILYEPDQSLPIDFESGRGAIIQTREFMNTVVDSFSSTKLLARTIRTSGLDKSPAFIAPRQDGQDFNDLELANRIRWMVGANQMEGTRVIVVNVEDTDPRRANLLATTLAEEFIKQVIEQRDSVANFEKNFLLREAERLKDELEVSEQELQNYREKHPGLSFREDNNLTIDQLTDIGSRVTVARGERLRIESLIKSLETADAGDEVAAGNMAALLELPQITQQQQRVAEARAQLGALEPRYGPLHPRVAEAQRLVEEMEGALQDAFQTAADQLQQQYLSAKQTEAKLDQDLRNQEDKALEQDRLTIRYNVLSREVESDRALYKDVMTRLKETTVRHGVRQIPFRIGELSSPNMTPIRPNSSRVLATGIAASLILALALVVGLDLLFSKYRTIEEVETALKLDPLAGVPEVAPNEVTLMMHDNPNSMAGEAFRNIRAQILLQARAGSRKIILITSANPGEGKSFVSLNTAASFALVGDKTLLIEADIRRPGIASQLHASFHGLPGLTDVLAGRIEAADVIVETGMDNLWLLPAGDPAINPAELLSKARMAELMQAAVGKYDRIVIDTAPINPVSDTLLICHYADAICLVIQANKTPRAAVDRAMSILKKAAIGVAGFILNRAVVRVSKQYAPYYESLARR